MEAPSGTVLDFSDPPAVPETALFSFNPLIYLYFMLSFLLVPYPIYRLIAARFKWETNEKSFARHWSDIQLGLSYGTILFVFGDYSRAYSWITVLAFYPALFGYALIAELPFTKTSLPNIRHWPKGMWVVFLIAVAIILAFAAFHIYLAATLALPFVVYYVCALLIPFFFFIVAILMIKEVNNNWTRTRLFLWRRPHPASPQPPADVEEGASSDSVEHATIKSNSADDPNDEVVQPYNPYTIQLDLHLHHWQIFYVLAFFTRFTHPASQVAAGIVLACYMEGICAYGYDGLVNERH